MLASNAPRVKWEAAKVVANIAHRFPKRLSALLKALLAIAILRSAHNRTLLPAIHALVERERDAAIRKTYKKALERGLLA